MRKGNAGGWCRPSERTEAIAGGIQDVELGISSAKEVSI